MTQEKEVAQPEMQVQQTAEPAKVVGMRYVMQSTLYDWVKILSILPAKFLCDAIKGLIVSQKDTLGETLVGYGANIFKTSLKMDDLMVGLVGRAMAFYGMKAYSPHGHPLQALETMTGTKTFSHTPEQNLREGRLGEYMAQRLLYTASTNVPAAIGTIVAKVLLTGMAMPATIPAFCAVYASTYTAILTARVVADVIQDVLGVSSLDPDRKKLLTSLQEMRERSQKTTNPTGKLAHV